MPFDKPQTRDYFKPAEHEDAAAILIEIKRISPQDPGGYKGKVTDAVYADLTVFDTSADITPGSTPKVYRNARIDKTNLYKELARIYAEGTDLTVRILKKWQGDRMEQPGWFWNYPVESIRTAVEDWYEAREAAVESDPDMPDFL